MKILVVSRANEEEYLAPILNRLSINHEVLFVSTPEAPKPLWFRIGMAIREYQFYFKKLIDQSSFWKERVILVRSPLPKWLLFSPFKYLTNFYKPHEEIVNKVRELQPDIVLATSVLFYPAFRDYDYMLAAEQFGIPLVGFVLTLDNLTNKSIIQVEPDLMFCWNDQHEQELIKYHDFKGKIVKVGPLKFEKWLLPQEPSNRKEFCTLYGLDPSQEIHTYLCSSMAIAPNEENDILEWTESHIDHQMLIKAHPNKPLHSSDLKIISGDSLNIYYHSDYLYGINSSCFIEAMLMGKKINILYKKAYKDRQVGSLHFQALRPALEGTIPIRKFLGIQNKLPSQLIVEYLEKCYN